MRNAWAMMAGETDRRRCGPRTPWRRQWRRTTNWTSTLVGDWVRQRRVLTNSTSRYRAAATRGLTTFFVSWPEKIGTNHQMTTAAADWRTTVIVRRGVLSTTPLPLRHAALSSTSKTTLQRRIASHRRFCAMCPAAPWPRPTPKRKRVRTLPRTRTVLPWRASRRATTMTLDGPPRRRTWPPTPTCWRRPRPMRSPPGAAGARTRQWPAPPAERRRRRSVTRSGRCATWVAGRSGTLMPSWSCPLAVWSGVTRPRRRTGQQRSRVITSADEVMRLTRFVCSCACASVWGG